MTGTYAIELRNISYQYQGHSQPTIHDIDLKIKKGSFVLISGAIARMVQAQTEGQKWTIS